MIHAREEYFPCATLLHLMSPLKQAEILAHPAALRIAMPAISIITRIYGTDYHLRPESTCYLIDKHRIVNGCRVDTHLVCASLKHTLHISQLVYTATHSKWDINLARHARYHIGKRFTPLVACRNVEKAQLVSTTQRILAPQFYRVASTT